MIAAQESMTAKLCSFARAYHSMLGKNKIFDDYLAYDIIGKDEYDKIGDLLKGQAEMTEQLGEPMGHGYSLDEMREILSAEGFVIRTLDPAIEAEMINGLVYHGKRYEGEEAGRIIIENQLAGIRKVAAAGVTVKVNTVLVNEINRFHIGAIAKAVKEAGATIYNIIPLIPQHDLKDCEAPSCADLSVARAEAGKYIDVFRHCQHCRADAVGVPGKNNFSKEVYGGLPRVKDTFSHG